MSKLMGKSSGTITTGNTTGNTDTGTQGIILNGEIPLNDNDRKLSLPVNQFTSALLEFHIILAALKVNKK